MATKEQTARKRPRTKSWKDSQGREIPKGARVRAMAGRLSGIASYRFTKVLKDGSRVPYIGIQPTGNANAAVTASLARHRAEHVTAPASDLMVVGARRAA